jgi:hypothetical protein
MATETLMQMAVNLGLDTSKFDKSLSQVPGQAAGLGKTISTGFGKTLSTGFASAGKLAMAGLGTALMAGGVAIAGTAKFISSTIDPAKDLAETMNKVGVVFGDSAEQVEAMGKIAASSLGISKQAAMESAGTFGNLFTSMQISREESADMSVGLVQLAADLASFNNASPEDVLLAMRSGLIGEAEPMRKFGVMLSQAALEEEALAKGLWSGKGALDAAAKAQAAYSLMLKQTTNAQGDFARTSEGLANRQRVLSATVTDLKASIGTSLLPVMEKGVGVITKYASSISTAINEGGSMEDTMGKITVILQDGAQEIAGMIATYLPAGVSIIISIVQGLVSAMPQIIPAILSIVDILSGAIITIAPQIMEAGISLITQLLNGIIGAIPTLIPAAIGIMTTFLTEIIKLLPTILTAGIMILLELMKGISQAVPTLIPTIVTVVTTMLMTLVGSIPQFLQAAVDIIIGLANGIITALPILVEQAPIIITSLLDGILTSLPMLIEAAIQLVITLVNGISSQLPVLIGYLPTLVQAILTGILDALPMIVFAAVQIVLTLATALVQNIPVVVGAIPQIITAIVDTFVKFKWDETGRAIVDGLKVGIMDSWENLKATLTKSIQSLKDLITGLFIMGSPSKWFAWVGKMNMKGLAMGIEKEKSPLQAMAGLSSKLTTAAGDISINSSFSSGSRIPSRVPAELAQMSNPPSAEAIGKAVAIAFMQMGLAK